MEKHKFQVHWVIKSELSRQKITFLFIQTIQRTKNRQIWLQIDIS